MSSKRPAAGSIVTRLSFAALLKRHRRAAGLTQEELAERAGISVNAVSALERGVNIAPRRDTVSLLADALGIAEAERAVFEAAARGRAVDGVVAQDASTPGDILQTDRSFPNTRIQGGAFPPLVGRVRELDLLRRQLDPITEPGAHPALLLVTGEPGIGKSRVLAEAAQLARAPGWTVLAGRCYRRGGQEPFAPLLAAIDGWIRRAPRVLLRDAVADCGWLARLLPELAEAGLIAPPRWTLPVDQERRLMFAAVRRFVAQVAGPAGTLLLLDDLQWAGADGLDLLTALVRSPDGDEERPLRIIGAYRDTELDRDGPLALLLADLAREGLVAQRELGRLGAGESAALLREVLGPEHSGQADESGPDASIVPEAPSAEAVRAVQLAGGVPFFLVSYAQSLRLGSHAPAAASMPFEQGNESPPIGRERASVAGVPWEVAQSIRARIAALPPSGPRLLGVAAVAGREVARAVLLAAATAPAEPASSDTAPEGLLDALDGACQAGLLVESGERMYAFGHELIREVVLAELSAARRELLHRRVAEALERVEGESPVERLAFHYAHAGVAAKAITYLARAADRAAAAHAYAVAADAYRELAQRLHDAGRESETAWAREQLGLALRGLGRNDEALACFEQVLGVYRDRGDLERMAWAAAQVGWAQVARGAPREGSDRLQALLRVFEEFEYPYGVALLRTVLADLYYAAGEYPRQLAEAERAAALAQTLGADQVLAQAGQLRGRALLLLGPLDEGLAVMSQAIAHSQSRDDLPNLCLALCMASLGYWLQGRFELQREYVEQALAAAMRLGDPALVALAQSGVGMVAWCRGEWDEARDRLAAAEAAIHGTEASLVVPYVAGVLGAIELATGTGGPSGGIARLEHAARVAAAIGDLVPQRFAQAALAEDDILHGRPGAARERLLPLVDRAGNHRETFAVPLIALRAWAELEMGVLGEFGRPRRRGVPGELGEFGRAWTRGEMAVARARAEGMRLALAEALRVEALVALRLERWDEAQRSLQEALALAREMPYPYAEAKALYVSGQHFTARGQPDAAREQYAAALAICERLGERMYATRIKALLATHA
jgi:tetratricopeptide (TPR) repeat protein/transcriptional regulator with XRE-family HTH domain